MSDGKNRIVCYDLLIEDVTSSAVKYLFEELESESFAKNIKVESFTFPFLYDILLLINFYDIDPSVMAKYKTTMETYHAETIKQHLDVIEVVEKIKMTISSQTYPDLDTLAKKSEDAILAKLTHGENKPNSWSSNHIPTRNLQIIADMLSENEDRLDVVVNLLMKLKHHFQ